MFCSATPCADVHVLSTRFHLSRTRLILVIICSFAFSPVASDSFSIAMLKDDGGGGGSASHGGAVALAPPPAASRLNWCIAVLCGGVLALDEIVSYAPIPFLPGSLLAEGYTTLSISFVMSCIWWTSIATILAHSFLISSRSSAAAESLPPQWSSSGWFGAGRRKEWCMLTAILLHVASCLACGYWPHYWTFLGARSAQGIASALVCTFLPVPCTLRVSMHRFPAPPLLTLSMALLVPVRRGLCSVAGVRPLCRRHVRRRSVGCVFTEFIGRVVGPRRGRHAQYMARHAGGRRRRRRRRRRRAHSHRIAQWAGGGHLHGHRHHCRRSGCALLRYCSRMAAPCAGLCRSQRPVCIRRRTDRILVVGIGDRRLRRWRCCVCRRRR
jgi:hypothetical protein